MLNANEAKAEGVPKAREDTANTGILSPVAWHPGAFEALWAVT